MIVFRIAGVVTFYLEMTALAGTLLGKGPGRLLVLLATVSSFVSSLPIGF